jgi:hypothetical protein
MTQSSEIPWPRLAAEGVAIVASILLAFAIDAWWDDLKNQEHRQAIFTSLDSAFSENLRLLDDNIAYASIDLERLVRFIEMDAEAAARIPPDETYDYLRSIWRPGTNISNSGFLVAMLEDSSLDLLDDRPLLEAVALWRMAMDELQERGQQLALNEGEALRALGHYSEVRLILARSGMGDSVTGPSVPGATMRRVREDPEVMAIAGRKALLAHIHLITLRNIRLMAGQVLERLRQVRDPGTIQSSVPPQ